MFLFYHNFLVNFSPFLKTHLNPKAYFKKNEVCKNYLFSSKTPFYLHNIWWRFHASKNMPSSVSFHLFKGLLLKVFHDLHEEVISIAARGHSLMIRVQQLEAEVPSIEKAFLSQTNHTSFFTSTCSSITYIVIFLPTVMVTTLFILMNLNN